MATTNIQICSNALILVGHGAIASFTDGGAGANTAAALYDTTYENLLSQYRWRFASAKKSLNRLVSAPLNEFEFAYQMPSNYIVSVGINPRVDFEIYEDKLYTNASAVDLDYIFKPDESKLPGYFQRLLELNLASIFAIPVTDNSTKAEEYRKMYSDQLRAARNIDSQSRPANAIMDSPLVDARF
jgi:hypothetical protein